MTFTRIATAALCLAPLAAWFALSAARADIAPPYPEYHTGLAIAEGEPYPVISDVAKGSPAEKAGVQKGDGVIALNGGYSKTGVPFYFFAKGLRGPQNSKLQLVALRSGRDVLVFQIARTVSLR
jgi:C-terminal processing protease CtpA/Prc